MLFDTKSSNTLEFFEPEPGLYHLVTDFVEAMNTLIRERHNHTETSVSVKVSQRTRKVDSHLANERLGLEFFTTDLSHFCGSNVGNDFVYCLEEKDLANQCLLMIFSAYVLS